MPLRKKAQPRRFKKLPITNPPAGTRRVVLCLPDSDEYMAQFWGQLSPLGWWISWEREETHRAKEISRYWFEILDANKRAYIQGIEPECSEFDAPCRSYAPSHPAITWAPQNPFDEPDLVPPGFLLPPWTFVQADIPLLGAQPGDVISTPLSFPQGADWEDLLTNGLARFRYSFTGAGTVELHLLNIPLGGLALVTWDDNPLTMTTIDMNRDLASAPPELLAVTVAEFEFETNEDHHIDVTFVPIVDDSLIPLRYGGGLRKVVFCSSDDREVTELDVRQKPGEPCTLQKKRNNESEWTDWANLRLCPPLLRQGEDGEIEYSTDGGETWEDVPREVDDPVYSQPPAPRGDNGACARAVNAMRVYNYFAQELANIIDSTPGNILQVIAGQFSRLFYDFWNAVWGGDLDAASSATALNLEILNYLGALFLDATAAGKSAGTYLREAWDGFAQDDVICAFYCAQNPDGTLNYSAAQARLLELVNADEIRATVKALVDCFGEGGFVAAQSVEGTVDRDCDDCECGQILLETNYPPGGYGTLTYLGGGRWRMVSESRGSDHAIRVRRVGGLCWYSSNYTFVSGSATYRDYRLCGAGSQTVGNPENKCITSFFMASNAPFTLEFDASECP